jgi:hypothetical protein
MMAYSQGVKDRQFWQNLGMSDAQIDPGRPRSLEVRSPPIHGNPLEIRQ